MARRKKNINLTEDQIVSSIIRFATPVFLTNFAQLIFNAFCVMITGKYAGTTALAAIGATNHLISLLTAIPNGVSNGTNVLVSRYLCAGKGKDVKEVVSTAVLFSIFSGIILIFVGLFFARPLLEWMNTPADTIDEAVLYLRIYMAGCPLILLHTFGSLILRSFGDSKRPFYFMMVAGAVRVLINYIMVVGFNFGVEAAAISYIISFGISGGLCIISLATQENYFRLNLKKMHFSFSHLKEMFKMGLPSGMQSICYAYPNIKISAGYNYFGTAVVAAHTADNNVENYVNTVSQGISSSTVTFVSANAGAKKFKRTRKLIITLVIMAALVNIATGNLAILFANPLLSLYTDDAEVLLMAKEMMTLSLRTYFGDLIVSTTSNALIGLGYSSIPMINTFLTAAVFRVIYLKLFFDPAPAVRTLIMIYPVSWALNILLDVIAIVVIMKKKMKESID